MSATAVKIPHDQALAAARAFQSLFDLSFYQRLEFGGSLRRGRLEVGDIEHLIIPATVPVKRPGALFDSDTVSGRPLLSRVDELLEAGEIAFHLDRSGHTRWGEKILALLWQGIVHELYLCSADTWGWHMAVRTGPAEFSRRLVTQLGRRGYVAAGGGRLVVQTPLGMRVLPVPDEQTLFRLAGEPYLEPERRER